MTKALLGNLDQSLRNCPTGQYNNYALDGEGVLEAKNSWKQWLPFRKTTEEYLTDLFTTCTNHWISLLNEERFRLRDIQPQEFTQHIKRIGLVVNFILVRKFNTNLQDKINISLTQLGASWNEISQLNQKLEGQITPEMLWRLQDSTPVALTPALLKIPAPQIEIWELPFENEDISELPALYQKVMPPKIPQTWRAWIVYWVFYLFIGHHSPQYFSLKKMVDRILLDKKQIIKDELSPSKVMTERYLKQIQCHYKAGKVPREQMQNTCQELAYAANQCPPDQAIVAETQYRVITKKVVTLHDRTLHWKATFVEQTLFTFFRTHPRTAGMDSHNANLMNVLDLNFGTELGRVNLEAPKVDIYASANLHQWESVVEFLKEQWKYGAVLRFLQERWKSDSIASFKTYIEMNDMSAAIGDFLKDVVKRKLPSIADVHTFVVETYFDEYGKVLNDQGVTRFLSEVFPNQNR